MGYANELYVEPSRTRRFLQEQAKQKASEGILSQLEAQLEEEERRNIRLSKELMDEVAFRARAERSLHELQEEFETVSRQLTDLEESKKNERTGRKTGVRKGRKRTGTSGTVPDSVQQSDGSTTSERESDAIPTDGSGNGSEGQPPKRRQSSRVRGKVK